MNRPYRVMLVVLTLIITVLIPTTSNSMTSNKDRDKHQKRKIGMVTIYSYCPTDKKQCPSKSKGKGAWGDKIQGGDIAISRDLLKHIKPNSVVCAETKDTIICGTVKDKMGSGIRKSIDVAIGDFNIFGKTKGMLFVME